MPVDGSVALAKSSLEIDVANDDDVNDPADCRRREPSRQAVVQSLVAFIVAFVAAILRSHCPDAHLKNMTANVIAKTARA